MIQRITHTSIIVRDIDEALKFYTDVLGFALRSDNPMGEGDRWVTVSPQDQPELEVILQPTHWGPGSSKAEREALIGKQPGFLLETQDIRAEIERLKGHGVEFTMELAELPWGTQISFKDLYGNEHVLSQPPQG